MFVSVILFCNIYNIFCSELETQQEKLRIMREKCENKVVPKNVRNKIDKKFNKLKQKVKEKESQLKKIEEVSFSFINVILNYKVMTGHFSAREKNKNRKNSKWKD